MREIRGRGVEREEENIFLVEAGVDAGEFDQAVQEEAGGGEEQDGERDLADDESAGEVVAGGRGAAAVAECWDERALRFHARGAESRQDAEEHYGADSEQEGEG